ncbi:MAG: hypothetical protein ACLFPU_07885 [Dehalococcoidia bacterium]
MESGNTLTDEEKALRSRLLKVVLSLGVFIASLLLFLIIPYFHVAISIVASFALAFLSYRSPAGALAVLFVLAAPGYIYQGEFPPFVVGSVIGLLLLLAAGSNSPADALGICGGIVAAMLMFTPCYYLALPVFLGITLFRTRQSKVGDPAGVVVFLALYLPFLASQQSLPNSDQVVFLFGQVNLSTQPTAPFVEASRIFTDLKNSIGVDQSIVDKLALYWPISEDGRFSGFVLLFSLPAAVSATFGSLRLFSWLEGREVAQRYLVWVAPIAALLVGAAVFWLLIGILQEPLMYSIDFSAGALFGLVVFTIVIGGIGASVEHWLSRRDREASLRSDLEVLSTQIKEKSEELQTHLSHIKGVCPEIDLFDEKKLIERCQRELASVSERLETMDVATLNDKVNLFNQLAEEIDKGFEEINRKLITYVNERWEQYRYYLAQASDFSTVFNDDSYQIQIQSLGSDDTKSILAKEKKLDEGFKYLAQGLVSFGQEISRTIKREIDPGFAAAGIEVAQNYLNVGSYKEAVEASLGTLSAMNAVVAESGLDLGKSLDNTNNKLVKMLRTSVIPLFERAGQDEAVVKLSEELLKLESMKPPSNVQKRLPSLLEIVNCINALSASASAVLTQLSGRIKELEEDIDSRLPSGYSWGKRGFAPRYGEDIGEGMSGKRGRSLSATVEAIEASIEDIETATAIMRHYEIMREFVINYPNIEYLIEDKLRTQGSVQADELPVKEEYAMRYLPLYVSNNYYEVSFDPRSGVIRYREESH